MCISYTYLISQYIINSMKAQVVQNLFWCMQRYLAINDDWITDTRTACNRCLSLMRREIATMWETVFACWREIATMWETVPWWRIKWRRSSCSCPLNIPIETFLGESQNFSVIATLETTVAPSAWISLYTNGKRRVN